MRRLKVSWRGGKGGAGASMLWEGDGRVVSLLQFVEEVSVRAGVPVATLQLLHAARRPPEPVVRAPPSATVGEIFADRERVAVAVHAENPTLERTRESDSAEARGGDGHVGSTAAPPGEAEFGSGLQATLLQLGFEPSTVATLVVSNPMIDVETAVTLLTANTSPSPPHRSVRPSAAAAPAPAPPNIAAGDGSAAIGSAIGDTLAPCDDAHGQVARHIIPADNSCLFSAVGFLAAARSGGTTPPTTATALRDVVAETVLRESGSFSEATLGKPPSVYAAWVRDPESWGGEIELLVLSRHFGIEIAVVEIASTHVYTYGGNEGHTRRAILLYDGVHYDAIVGRGDSAAARLFPTDDQSPVEEALALATTLQQQRRFVSLTGCSLRCLVCGRAFVGEKEAVMHATATMHQNFAQVET